MQHNEIPSGLKTFCVCNQWAYAYNVPDMVDQQLILMLDLHVAYSIEVIKVLTKDKFHKIIKLYLYIV